MKFVILVLTFIFCIPAFADTLELKQNAFALYNTNHIEEAQSFLTEIPDDKKDKEVYLILSNIEEEKNNDDAAILYLNNALNLDAKFYKAYYNLGVIYMKKRLYQKALDNFKLAQKYTDENAYIYYNIGCAYIGLYEYKKAKRYFVRAICVKNDEKDFYYNLAYVNKKLGNEKDAKKIIDFYNKTFNQT